MIKIIHFSDLHLNQQTLRDWKNYIQTAFIDKLKEINKEKEITFIAFTGDLIDTGGSDFDSTANAFKTFNKEVITPILSSINLGVDRFFIVPGNHDIVRSLDHKRIELGNRSYFKEGYKNISEFIVGALKKNEYDGMERMRPFKEFESLLYAGASDCKLTMFGSSFIQNVDETSVGIACLNSSWRCYDKNDSGRLIVGEDQLNDNIKFISKCEVKIALLHHPLDWLVEEERAIITSHLAKDFDLLLMGHVHESKTSIATGFTGTLFKNIAPSGLNDIRSDSRTFSNGFTVIDFYPESKKIFNTYWRYSHQHKNYVLNSDLGNNGFFEYLIPSQQSKKSILLENSLIENIKEDYFQKMNNHLITTKSSSSSLCIKEAFVLPPIDEGISFEDVEQEINTITLEEIMASTANLMFFGSQESGKTALLFRLIRQYVDEYSYLQKIPVYIDFSDLGNKEFTTAIKEYLRCNSEEVNSLLKSNKIVLIIDNLNFKKIINIDQRNKLMKLYRENNSLKIIAAADTLTPGMLPLEYIELCKIPFRNLFLKNLGAKEIKSIMKMWLPEETELNSEIRLDKLVTSFNSYALPSSAMSVSLFLWSMEYPERKPINNSVLLEIYIEILLQKLGQFNVYREHFDFTNKLQLLSKIAQEMFDSTEVNYSITFSQFQSIIERYLSEEVSFPFDAEVISDYFIERKIFTKYQNNKIKFSHSCFFHFFIAKRMIFSSTFKNHILSKVVKITCTIEAGFYSALVAPNPFRTMSLR